MPTWMLGPPGDTVMLLSTAAPTVTLRLDVTAPLLAVMIDVPAPTAVTRPFTTVATPGVPGVQVTLPVTFALAPSVAVNCSVCPACRNGRVPGDKAMLCRNTEPTIRFVVCSTPPEAAVMAVIAMPMPTDRAVCAGLVPGDGTLPSQTSRTI